MRYVKNPINNSNQIYFSSKYNDEVGVVYSKSDKIEIMIDDRVGDFIRELNTDIKIIWNK